MGRRSREPGHGESRGSHRTLAEGPGEDSPEGANLAYALFSDFQVSTTVRGRISAVLSHPVFGVLSQRPQCHTTLPSRPCKPSKLESDSPERAVKRKTFVRPIVTSLTFKETEVTRKTTQRH